MRQGPNTPIIAAHTLIIDAPDVSVIDVVRTDVIIRITWQLIRSVLIPDATIVHLIFTDVTITCILVSDEVTINDR